MKFGSVCSGIEAASVAWGPLGWKAAWFSEIEKFPCAVLQHHYPEVPNYGDMSVLPERILSGEIEAPDLLCGGTPCQAFSVAGLRKSLDDARGNLSLKFCELANAIDNVRSVRSIKPSIIFWENVPGVLNTSDNAFGCFLGALAGEDEPLLPAGGKWSNAGCVFGPQRAIAWRVLDAQYFGVAQRRRRVFVVASARDDFDPAAVLFEFESLRRDTAPSREARQGTAGGVEIGPSGGRFTDLNPTLDTRAKDGPIRNQLAGAVMQPYSIANTLTARMHKGINSTLDEGQTPVIMPSVYEMHGQDSRVRDLGDVCSTVTSKYGTGGGNVPITFHPTQDPISSAEVCHTIGANSNATAAVMQPIAFDGYNQTLSDICQTIRSDKSDGDHVGMVMQAMQVRRLTPVECERLQGFPDNYTDIKDQCPDGPRYKALGNSWAVPVVRWIGARIQGALK